MKLYIKKYYVNEEVCDVNQKRQYYVLLSLDKFL